MGQRTSRFVMLTLCGLALLAMIGCGGTPEGEYRMARPMDIVDRFLEPFIDNDGQTPRWMDVADYLYSPAIQQVDTLYGAGLVQLSYTTLESPLKFTVSAPPQTLKPNFCYQMKLEGPSQAWVGDPDGADFANAQLGYNGRWWCDTCNQSLNDKTVKVHMRKHHHVKGYLYFDFLVTDHEGKADYSAEVNNSYHVTWKTVQQAPAGNDGPVRWHEVIANKTEAGWAYDQDYPTTSVGVYGQWEPDRPLPGGVQLANGTYEGVEFRLTEESFHSTAPLGGNWRTVMRAGDLSFTIGGPATDVAVTNIHLPMPPPRTGQWKTVTVTVANSGDTALTTTVSLADASQAQISTPPTQVSLNPGHTTTVQFAWQPLESGTHLLRAEASPVPGEEDISNNTATKSVRVK